MNGRRQQRAFRLIAAATSCLGLGTLVVAVTLSAALASCASPSASSGVGGASPAAGQSASPSAIGSAPGSAPASAPGAAASSPTSGSGTATQVTVPLGGPHSVVVTIEDRSGGLVSARPAVLQPDQQIPASYGEHLIAAWNPGGKPSPEVWLYWGGVICDTTTEMVVGRGPTAITVTEGPRPACDASNDGRGVVLTFASAVDASQVAVTFVPAKPIQ